MDKKQMDKKQLIKLVATTAVLGASLAGFAPRASAVEPDKSQLIGVVDMTQIYSAPPDAKLVWTQFKDLSTQLDNQRADYKAIIDDVVPPDGGDAAIPPIKGDSLTTWLDLKEKSQLHAADFTPADKTNLKTLEDSGKAATGNLQALIAKGDGKTPQEKQQYEDLTKLRQDASEILSKRATDYSDKLQQKANDARVALDAALNDAIKQVAAANKIVYVLSKSFVTQQGAAQPVLLYTSDKDADITDKVIKQLNKTYK